MNDAQLDWLHLARTAGGLTVWHLDLTNGRLQFFGGLASTLGFRDDELPSHIDQWVELIHPEDRKHVSDATVFHFSGGTPECRVEYRIRTKNGGYRWFLSACRTTERAPTGYPLQMAGTMVEITSLKQTAARVEQSEDHFRTLVDALPGGVVQQRRHPDGRFELVYSNEFGAQLLGMTTGERIDYAAAMSMWTHPDDLAEFDRVMEEAVTQLKPIVHECRFRVPPGDRIMWMQFRYVPITCADGTVLLNGFAFDVTDRKLAEASARETELLLHSITAGVPGVLYRMRGNPVTQEVYHDFVSAGVRELIGLEPEEMHDARAFSERIHPEDQPATIEAVMLTIATGAPVDVEYRITHRDGSLRWVRGKIRLTERRADGWLIFDGFALDITDRKRAETAAHEMDQKLHAITASVPGIVFRTIIDGDTERAEFVSAAVWNMLGITPEQLVKKFSRRMELIHADDREQYVRDVLEQLELGKSPDVKVRMVAANGDVKWVRIQSTLQHQPDGRIINDGVITDISHLIQIEEELKRAKDDAESASRAKSEFLAHVSHEIRTPMNAILGMTELALDTPLTSEQNEYLTIVKSSAESLLGVINDILDFSKIEAGKLELDLAPFSLRSVVGSTVRSLAFRAHRKGLELACRIGPDVPDGMFGDAGRFRQVLVNLVGNAVKFTESGEIVVEMECDEEGRQECLPHWNLRFSVRDTGIGIPLPRQKVIFDAFVQEDSSTTRRYDGTGLGLTIASRLLSLMDGTISVESTPGKGSTFTCTAKFGVADAPPSPDPADLRSVRVLVTDDNQTNRLILQELLTHWQMVPTMAESGATALGAMWRAVAAGKAFPLIILDANMPGMDGFTLAEQVRQSPELSASRIVMLTSSGQPGDAARSKQLGIAAYLTKPVHPWELLETLHRVLSQGPNPRTTPAITLPVERPKTRSLRILVAEDNEYNQRLAMRLLEKRGHNVTIVGDGPAALEALEMNVWDLAFLDVRMPGMDGLQVIEEWRRREQVSGRHLPIVAVTAHSMKGDRERCLNAGMDGYLSKPIRADELDAELVRWAKPMESLLDSATILAVCGGDQELLDEMIELFRSRAPELMHKLQKAIETANALQISMVAHSLKGMLSTFSTAAAKVAHQLEQIGTSGGLDEAKERGAELTEMFDRLMPELRDLSVKSFSRILDLNPEGMA